EAVAGTALKTIAAVLGHEVAEELVVKRDLDYFRDPRSARLTVENFAKTFTPQIEFQLLVWLKEIENSPPGRKRGTVTVPLLYMQALYHELLVGNDATVASVSYWTYANGFR